MDLSSKFRTISACEQIKISALKQNVAYPIERAERVQTKYGETVLATLCAESPQTFLKVFLPRRYGVLFSDGELQHKRKDSFTKPQILGHKHRYKFLHLGNRIGILVHF